MDYRDYQIAAHRTSNAKSSADSVLNGCMGLVGEAGEVVDVVKKRLFQGLDHAKAVSRMKEELGDVCWYVAEVCTGLNVNLDELMISDDAVCIMHSTEYQNMPMAVSVMQMSLIASEAYMNFCNGYPMTLQAFKEKLCCIPRVFAAVRYMLENFCGSSIEECMQNNINKLKERYPQGFDADRSNHREQASQQQ